MQLAWKGGCGGGGRCFRRISKPFPNEGAMRGVCHLGLGILGEGEDRWTARQSQGEPGGTWARSSN